MDLGFLSAVNGIIYAGSDAGTGKNMYTLDAATGQILWSFASGGSVVSGAAVVNGSVYWGSGYYIGSACPPGGTACGSNDKLYAFTLRYRTSIPQGGVRYNRMPDDRSCHLDRGMRSSRGPSRHRLPAGSFL
jgi:hypothetical protein